MRVLGCDPGTKYFAWALYDSEQDRVLAVDHRKFNEDHRIARLQQVRQYVREILPTGCDVDVVAVERMFSKRDAADFLLHVTSFFVQERAMKLGMLCVELSPSTVKKRFAGHGHAKKADMQAEALRRFGIDCTDDEADAIGVAVSAAQEEFDGEEV